MGGSSKSSSSSSNRTENYDNRIGATDGATVVAGGSTLTNNVSYVDPGLVDMANKALLLNADTLAAALGFGDEALDSNERIVLEALAGARNSTLSALSAIGENAAAAFNFVDNQRTDEQERTARTLIPWLVAGVSAVAITAMWGRK